MAARRSLYRASDQVLVSQRHACNNDAGYRTQLLEMLVAVDKLSTDVVARSGAMARESGRLQRSRSCLDNSGVAGDAI